MVCDDGLAGVLHEQGGRVWSVVVFLVKQPFTGHPFVSFPKKRLARHKKDSIDHLRLAMPMITDI